MMVLKVWDGIRSHQSGWKNTYSWERLELVLFSPPTSNHHLTNLPQDLVFIAGKDLSLGTIQQHFNKIKFAGLSIKTKTIKCGKHGAIVMMDEFSENFQKAFDKIY